MGWPPGTTWETGPYTELTLENPRLHRGMSNGVTLMGRHELDGVLCQSFVSRILSHLKNRKIPIPYQNSLLTTRQLPRSPRTLRPPSLPPLRPRPPRRLQPQRRHRPPRPQIPGQLPRHHLHAPLRRLPLTDGVDQPQMVLLVRSLLVHGPLPRIRRRYTPLPLPPPSYFSPNQKKEERTPPPGPANSQPSIKSSSQSPASSSSTSSQPKPTPSPARSSTPSPNSALPSASPSWPSWPPT